MRALLVCNPKATTTSDRVRDVLVSALRSETDLDVAYTRRRGHGASLSRNARKNGVDVVVALGGDGTVNEVVNGLLADGTGEDVPALAVVSGGSTNVFARALGLPTDWAEGTAAIIEALRDGRTRSIGLGKATPIGRADGLDALGRAERYFTFCAGMGLDADVIHRVERARMRGRKSTPLLYLQSMAGNYVFEKVSRTPRITIDFPHCRANGEQAQESHEKPSQDDDGFGPDQDTERDIATDSDDADMLSMVVVQNTAPWTYIGERPIEANPEASFDLGLDVMALRNMNVFGTSRTITQLLAGRHSKESGEPIGPHGKQILRLHDLSEFTLRAKLPAGFQVDGDYLGERDEVRFSSVPDAIRVVC